MIPAVGVCGTFPVASGSDTWPCRVPVGRPSTADLNGHFAAVQSWAFEIKDWAARGGLPLADETRRAHGTNQLLPTHVTIASADAAAALLGNKWPERLARGRARAAHLGARFPGVDAAALTKATDTYTDADFALLCDAAEWFARNDATGLTARQVPIEGLHAKWLNTHAREVRTLAGVEDLGLLPKHPARLHFTYLDPSYLHGHGRRHDSITVGDSMAPAYAPQVVIISENKDTAIYFPALAGGIAVEGGGNAGPQPAAQTPWLAACPNVFYWGDMDAVGLTILNDFRAAGLQVRSLLMDRTAFASHERFGATTDANGLPLNVTKRRDLPFLTPAERELYNDLTDPSWTRVRRVEQERIPLPLALDAVVMALAES
ncbi:DUF3322 and DUF2220 domain-containing protein [Pseudarthrobacter albicanus]|uniref:DUF3322 and DUF2220 domain-containing protein n=1 Tax=Pseudarthrobacter albicanus TaxID=2823873 RepID=UPI001BA7254B|nr:DUF3322 and DUF2220 domain-containing protein [Pseudarthrobacter albicanus]